MEISVFEGANKNELSMIEVAHAILEQRGDVMDFSDLANEIQTYLGKSDSDIRDSLAQFYTDLNIDGSFISLGDNRWGLRSWYAIDSIDEEVNHGIDEEDEDTPRRRKRKKVNAFINDDEDAIDYNDDDPEDTDLSDEDDDDLFEDEDDDDEEIAAYNSDLQEIGADTGDDEEEIPGNIEEDLSIIEDDDDEEDEEFEDEDFPEE
ncbi:MULTISPECIES: DNA-directed RNA polymerase subunit delta [Enterococcus]|uniref:Probable DNA-directed RNA polymerase subunit delta n=1 Tax=Candidatus Enterococcus mangumiae TaxID=2230878 RepID=A0ABZ2SSA7_9ENTE|nr:MULTISPECIES: DNA-directed RNA polymerase subunit delta [Enterococcus]MBO0460752.1 DNA-directed RNA polymerase subunit delta [Enterococcus sp. DIV1298c]MBO0488778.1 DNA-directed RNA polymerase subunit delta [Enterococcus sp. DIV1094]MBO1299070.1 DNA-directed RNA polymerase subunit delta [Enterococcus sp. DIV1271a]MDA9461507.1 DNA-directed RNA polymerase delta subunit [Enterococcus mundtii 3F]PTO40392.1 DNA-directed RNA polymerase subunit delta [Enterococcus mundtii]